MKDKKINKASGNRPKADSSVLNPDYHYWIAVLLLIGYGFIAVVTPNLMTFDSNGPKFLAMSLLNIIGWGYLMYYDLKNKTIHTVTDFFKTKTGIVYTLFIMVSLLSFTKSINVIESVVQFSKLFTTFAAAWIISILLMRNPGTLKYLIIAMTGLLLFDSLRVFAETSQFIKGDIASIGLIKAGYSNKNILAAALFIKLPFALWLLTFKEGWLRIFGIASLFCGLTAVFFMSARAFYIGLIFIAFFYTAFLVIRYLQTKEKSVLKVMALFFISLALAFFVFTFVQKVFYPDTQSGYNRGFAGRLATVTADDGGGGRLKYWKMTVEMIKEQPLLGVGLGNWKIAILEKENHFKSDFTLMFKAHNDFLEIAGETGIIGFFSFIALFSFIIILFLRALFFKNKNLSFLFIAAFGLICYAFDAFFNFPHDRPEIQSLFAIFIGAGIAISFNMRKIISINHEEGEKTSPGKRLWHTINFSSNSIVFLTILSSTYILYLNFQSLKTLRLIKDQQKIEIKTYNSDYLIRNFPSIPNIAPSAGDPINTLIASQLIDEEKYDTAIFSLKQKNPSPFDTRREFLLSLAYSKIDSLDIGLYYIDAAYKQKPLYYIYTKQYANILELKGNDQQAVAMIDTFLANTKNEKEAWQYSAALHFKSGNIENSLSTLDSAMKYFPNDTTLLRLKDYYTYNSYMPYYADAIKHYNNENYPEAIKYFQLSEEGFEKAGGHDKFPDFLNSWARSHLNINEISSAKKLFLRVYNLDPDNYYALINLGNIAFHNEKKYTEATNYFEACIKAKNPDLWLSHSNLGTLYLIQGKKEQAIEHYEIALKYGSSTSVIRNLYLLWQEKGNPEKITYYQQLMN